MFADLTYDLTDDLSVSVGGRYTEDERSADIFRGARYRGPGRLTFLRQRHGNQLALQTDYQAERTYDDFSPRINFAYSLNDDANVYAGYSQGLKAGSFDPRGANFSPRKQRRASNPRHSIPSNSAIRRRFLMGGRGLILRCSQ